MDKIQIKDLDSGVPVAEDYLVFQKATGGKEVYKSPKSEIEGEDAFVYIAYADDDIGTGFTNTFNASKNYIAILPTNTEILSPVVGDFAGLWKNYKGEHGDAATNDVGSTTTLKPGSAATVVNVGTVYDAIYNFGIPAGSVIYSTVIIPDNSVGMDGDWAFSTAVGSEVYYKSGGAWALVNDNRGEKGETGASIVSAAFVGNNLVFTLDDATTVVLTDAKLDLKGDKGDTGDKTIIYSTVGIPLNTVGVDGDWAFDTSSNSNVYYKSAGTWALVNSNKGVKGDTGVGIASITKTGTVGLVDTYTITYDDATTDTFDITNGAKGDTGNGIDNIALHATVGKVKTYRITYTDATIFDYDVTDGTDGIGAGDMLASVYDPAGKASQVEVISNKATTFGTINDTLYPTVKAVNDAIVSAVAGLLDYRGAYDCSTNLFPATGGSGIAGAILKGDFWICSVAGTLGGVAVTPGDLIIALQDTPAQTAANWDLVEHELGYAPENSANKVTSISGSSTDVQYPSAKLLYDQLALKAPLRPVATKVTLVDADETTGNDSAASFGQIKTTWTNVKAFLKTWIDAMTSTFTNKTLNDLTNYIDADALHLKCFLNLGGASTLGMPVYSGAWNVANTAIEVSKARANAVGTMPCLGLMESAGADGTVGSVRISGLLTNVDTSVWSEGTALYVSAASAGVLTATKPTGVGDLVQRIGTVIRQHATLGVIEVMGAGRSNDVPNTINMIGSINESKGADIASATTTDIGVATGNFIDVTGTTTITGLGTIQAGTRRVVKFTGALILTHNATSLILPTGANITTVAGDTATFISLGSGNWICTSYQKKDGSALVGGGRTYGSTVSSATPSINTDLYNIFELTAQAVDVTSFTTNLSGSPKKGDLLKLILTNQGSSTFTPVGTPQMNQLNGSSDCIVNTPGSIQEGDFIYAHISSSNYPSVVPTGFILITQLNSSTASDKFSNYYKIATASEPSTYTWNVSSGYLHVVMSAFRGGFDKSNPIQVSSNTDYVVSNTTLRAASMTLTKGNAPIIFSGGYYAASTSFTPPSGFTEIYDNSASAGPFYTEVAYKIQEGIGATGNMDSIMSGSQTRKGAIAVALNPVPSRALAWGTSFASLDYTLPAATSIYSPLELDFIWNESGTSKWETKAIATRSKSMVSTYDISTATGYVQKIPHKLGKIPTRARIKATCITGTTISSESFGNYDLISGNKCIYLWQKEGTSTAVADVSGNSSSVAIILSSDATASNIATGVITFDADNTIITWTKTGTPTGTANILLEVE